MDQALPVETSHVSPDEVVRRAVDHRTSAQAQRTWWDAESATYLAEHSDVLGEADLCWGPEGVRESELGLLGDVRDLRVLEFGGGAGQGARWCATQGAHAVTSDLSGAMVRRGLERVGPADAPDAHVQCDAGALPFADASFDVVFTAYGALPFVPDGAAVLAECARVLRPGGRCVFSVTHPVRWAFPDVPGEAGLTVSGSYFDRRPYVEQTADGHVTYVEHHRTLGDRVREIRAAGLVLEDLVEPEWPQDAEHEWGGWSRLRGEHLPGTAIFVTRRPG